MLNFTFFQKHDNRDGPPTLKSDNHIMKILKQAIHTIKTAELGEREELIQQYSDQLSKVACRLCSERNHEQYGRFLLAIDPDRYKNVLGQGAFHNPAILQYQVNSTKIKQFLESVLQPIDPHLNNKS